MDTDLIAGPGIAIGLPRRIGRIGPTVLDMAGLPRHPGMVARSLWALLQGKTDQHREDVYAEYLNANPDSPRFYLSMLRTQKHKIVNVAGEEFGELYDPERDPGEHHNRWQDPDYQVLKGALLKRLSDRQTWACDPLPARTGIY